MDLSRPNVLLEQRLRTLEKRVVQYRIGLMILGVLLALVWIQLSTLHHPPAVLRARGLVIEDAMGRDRILLGAPIPFSAGRMRTDTAAVRRLWGRRMAPEYMKWYGTYRHEMSGMLVLDEHGVDRVGIGQDYPDPIIGKRIGRATGIVINNSEGLERSGYGLLNVDGQDRMVLGLDGDSGNEGVVLVVRENGTSALSVADHTFGRTVLVGSAAPKTGHGTTTDCAFGVFVSDSSCVTGALPEN